MKADIRCCLFRHKQTAGSMRLGQKITLRRKCEKSHNVKQEKGAGSVILP
ncbi:hypothetical protein SAMN02982996_01357 [Lonsdalea quercina]|uniref:Uncharacterized protein n=1 Tax=Lonsdalea quercina TaxID=71657 RepID=A0A1H3ZXZ4_9GAMM|nr:hypothetical protein SAMN02982996_01357 [Lonsdalea quercina]